MKTHIHKRMTVSAVARISCAILASTSLAISAGSRVSELSWGFNNFPSTGDPGGCPEIKPVDCELFRDTFLGSRVDCRPSSWALDGTAPEKAFYDWVYEKLAVNGNCYGMSLMTLLLDAKGGHLGFCGPAIQYGGDVFSTGCQGHISTGPSDAYWPGLRRVIGRMHGYQVNEWTLKHLLDSKGKDFDDAMADLQIYKTALISLTDHIIFPFTAHTMVAYKVTIDASGEPRIHVYDPNYSWENPLFRHYYEQDQSYIKKDGAGWKYRKQLILADDGLNIETNWSKYDQSKIWSGGYIMVTPLSVAGQKGRSAAAAGLNAGEIFCSGAGSSLVQVSDDQGRRLFVPGSLALEGDPTRSLEDITPFIPSADGSSLDAQVLFVYDHIGAPKEIEVRPGPAGYELSVLGARSSLVVSSSSPIETDKVRVQGAGSPGPALVLYNPYGRIDYQVTIADQVSEEKRRLFRLSNLSTPRGAPVLLQVANNRTALKVISPYGDVHFELEIVSLTRDGSQSVQLGKVSVPKGCVCLVGPSTWNSVAAAELASDSFSVTSKETGELLALSWNKEGIFYLDVKHVPGGLQLNWPSLGTNYVYTLESSPSLSNPTWTQVPGALWPVDLTTWGVQTTEPGAKFYRVLARHNP